MNRKNVSRLLFLLLMIGTLLTGCSSGKRIYTPLGILTIKRAELVDEFSMTQVKAGYKILMIYFECIDSDIDANEFFDETENDVYVGDPYGDTYYRFHSGKIDGENPEYSLGFVVPDTFHSFTLYWLDNDPINLEITEAQEQ